MANDPAFHVEEVKREGFSIAQDVIDDAFCEEIKADIRRFEKIGPPNIRSSDFTGYQTLRYFDLINKGEVWERVAAHPFVLEVIRGILGNDMLLSTMGTAVIDPGETPQRIHCDDQLYGIRRPHKNLVCNTMWALSDFTIDNGATHVLPGSHKFEHYPDDLLTSEQKRKVSPIGADQNYETVQAAMPKGSICFIVGTCYHGGGANVSRERRWGLTINYCAGSQRQQENLMLAHSRSKMRTFSDELQQVIGLRSSNFGVGHINAGDPKSILNSPD